MVHGVLSTRRLPPQQEVVPVWPNDNGLWIQRPKKIAGAASAIGIASRRPGVIAENQRAATTWRGKVLVPVRVISNRNVHSRGASLPAGTKRHLRAASSASLPK